MGKVIGIVSIKGGVGKTSISASLAADIANKHHKKVLLVDGNFSAPNLGLHMDIVEPESTIHDVMAGKSRIWGAVHRRFGVDVVPGSYVYEKNIDFLKLKERLSKIKDAYDFVIIDSSPSLNDELLATMLSSDNLFVVSTPDYPTLSCSLRAAKIAKQNGKPISGIIINKIRDPKHELSLSEIESATNIPVIARIPDDVTNLKAVFTRIPTSLFDDKSKFSKEISRLSSALTNNAEKRSIWHKILPLNYRKEQVNRQLLRDSFYDSTFN